jgi:hypothetical protein
MRLNYGEWQDGELFNFVQILMIAKFDSMKSELLVGQPMLLSLMKEILDRELSNKALEIMFLEFRNRNIDDRTRALVLGAAKEILENREQLEITPKELEDLAFPFQIPEGENDEMRKILSEHNAE